LAVGREGEGRTALVTGASAGIGKAFAELLAARGYRLVLTARRLDRLEELAASLGQRHGVPVHIVVADLSDPAAPGAIVSDLQARHIQVDVLVNNAGYGLPGRFDRPAWAEHDAFLRVMVTAVCELTYRLLPGWSSGGGAASSTSRRWRPLRRRRATRYAATKSFLIRFSRPSPSAHPRAPHRRSAPASPTEFRRTGTRAQVSRMPASCGWGRDVVAQGYDAVMRGEPVYITGHLNRALAWLSRVLPQGMARRLIARSGKGFRRMD
jgi:short-subunit dehydrogenase